MRVASLGANACFQRRRHRRDKAQRRCLYEARAGTALRSLSVIAGGRRRKNGMGRGAAIAVTFVLSGRLIIDHVREALEHPLAVGSLLEALFSMADDADNKSGRY